MSSVTPVSCFRSNRILWCNRSIPLGATISLQEKQLATYSLIPLIQLHSMNLVLYKHHIFIIALCCDSRTKPIHDKFQKTLLGNWCQRGRERSHQSLSLKEITSEKESITSSGGERDLQGREYSSRKYFSRIPDAWCSRGEMPHVFVRGKACSYVLICISSVHLFLWALFFCSLSSPSIPC